jgi:hypothetical protein
VDNLEKFLAEAIGQKYSLNGLLKRSTTKLVKGKNELIHEDRTFFCSELVAKAYKLLGIIEDDKISCT